MAKEKLTKTDALNRLMSLCSRSEKCRSDIYQKLRLWGVSDYFDEICEKLESDDFLCEDRYASSFVNDKITFSKWGKRKVRFQLLQKGINEKEIDAALNSYDRTKYAEMVRKELEKKKKSLKISDPFQQKQKLYAFAAHRGYEPDFIGDDNLYTDC